MHSMNCDKQKIHTLAEVVSVLCFQLPAMVLSGIGSMKCFSNLNTAPLKLYKTLGVIGRSFY